MPTDRHVVEAIELKKIYKDFWGRPKAHAVNGIDFVVKSGEILGILGPNGSGKSTTMQMILGLLMPTSGFIRVFGESPKNIAVKHRIGYLPEETYLYSYLTAFETLNFFGALFNLHPSERRRRADQLLEMVGLSHASRRPVAEFSKGMARRIGLAQAIINDPELVILDEPTSGLDPVGCREVKNLIRVLAEKGKSIILCSHLLADMEDICDRVMIMYGGRIRAVGALNELLLIDHRTRITSPKLEHDVLELVMNVLNDFVDTNDVVVDNPSLSLEDYFMQVVRQAWSDRSTTSGVESGGKVPVYLTDSQKEGTLSGKGFDDLVVRNNAGKLEPEETVTRSSEREPTELPDRDKLSALVKGSGLGRDEDVSS